MDTSSEGMTRDEELQQLLDEMLELRESIVLRANRRLTEYYSSYIDESKSACNLAHYLALREEDRRPLQDRLARFGLSSLGRGEPHVLGTLDAIIRMLMRATGQQQVMGVSEGCHAPDFAEGAELLGKNAADLFGPAAGARSTRIMVTLPTEAALEPKLVQQLLRQGTDCVRINCAHDDRDTWAAMIRNIRRATDETGRPCRILMDVAGHKLRTGPIVHGPPTMHLKVKRDHFGHIVAPSRLLLTPLGSPFEFVTQVGEQQLALPVEWFKRFHKKAILEFVDSRGKSRRIELIHKVENGAWRAECRHPAYLTTKTRFTLFDKKGESVVLGKLGPESLPSKPLAIWVHSGDELRLDGSAVPGAPAQFDEKGRVSAPAHISCTLPKAIEQARPGDPVWIDDGNIGAVVAGSDEHGLLLKITHTPPKGGQIREDKGLNFPDTSLQLPPLSDRDCEDLDFICKHADMIGFSFVESFSDMQRLIDELEQRDAGHLPIIAKIETQDGVKNLPEILLGTIGQHQLGIMIARGDLAVELGSVRMAEIQEEILWLCEAAHVPVIWATQVLETIAKKGIRSRPEFTDAAMGVRAECVMLNKGPYINDAVRALDHLLERMQDHQHKKFSRMRALHLHW